MKIEATSKYDWETVKRFNKFHNFTKSKALNIVVILMDALSLLGFLIIWTSRLLTFELIMIYVVLLFANFMIVFTGFILPKIQYKQNKLLHGVVNKFTFENNKILIEQCGENTSATVTVSYGAIWRVYETKEYIYIYLNSRQAHTVDKSTIVGGTFADLRNVLSSAVGTGKYKIKSRV